MALAQTPPKPKMLAWRVTLAYTVAVIGDALKLFFNFFIFTAPVFVGLATKSYLEAEGWSSWVGNIAGLVTGSAGAALEIGIPAIGAAIQFFGIIMAIVIGGVGWALLLIIVGTHLLASKNLLKALLGLGASIIPFLNLFPTLTPTVWLVVRDMRKEDHEARKRWEKEQETTRSAPLPREVQRVLAGNPI
ncbi:hypothetical protein A3H77_00200 [Candidatus Kaiserbacteria bacterium RIFCSPLOWO2_02_FULL_56_11]|uniref:Uncharacterized protein n=2 Tax=Candidatus Kaiseribacteriota TaxID=1752734 RepID=A0A1F6E292_9BACT|nr:MAG: hypothetical protein A3C95_00470 [Candidatus Kaiserbacteria bacterium RIFCSPHIGHO2_02_FULL_56_30]OGG72353.1 MAG: hypothetical protein A3E65_01470 [Candidatus Kaiserbacteria bacterium RIFCSPHIGHO2_12_FULL_56_13]OGG80828.1 MAG: hypothetical protein A3H77_00200 [Candidatus Kaiserbacteria bacterium RIFCSPLOWO2_02_FULL_56_11]